METKTIRFEKDKKYEDIFFLPELAKQKYFQFDYESMAYRCTQSFTVQINIIEDEQ